MVFREKEIKLSYWFIAFLSLASGIIIYFYFRNINNILLWQYISKPDLFGRTIIPIKTDTIWKYLVIFNIPNGLWCLSGISVIRAIWLHNKKNMFIYCFIWIAFTILFEISQLINIISGTFDKLDLIIIGIFAFFESMIYIIFIKRRVV